MRLLPGHVDGTLAITYSPDGHTLATGGVDRKVWLRDPVSGDERVMLKHPSGVHALAYSPDGQLLASGGGSMALRLSNPVSGRTVARLPGHTAVVKCVAFTPNGRTLVSGAGDRTLSAHRSGQALVRDLTDGGQNPTIVRESSHGILAIAVAPDGTFALATGNREIILYNPVGTPLREFHQPVQTRALLFSADGRVLIGAVRTRIVVWDASDGKQVAAFDGHSELIAALANVPNSPNLLASGSWDGTVRLWDLSTGRETRAFDWRLGKVSGLAFAPDGMTAAAACKDGVAVWDVD